MMTARDRDDLALRLISENYSLLTCTVGLTRWRLFSLRWFHRADITRFTQQLSLLLLSRVSLVEALDMAGQPATATSMSPVAQILMREIETGRSFTSAIELFPTLFDGLYRSVAAAGEATGELGESLARLASQQEQKDDFSRKIRVALAYPLFVLVTAIIVVICLIVFVIPVFGSLYANVGSDIPRTTQWLIRTGEIAQKHWFAGLLAAILASLATVFLLIKCKGYLRSLLWRLPGTRRVLQRIVAARFAHALGTLLCGGVDAITASQLAAASTGDRLACQRLSSVPDALARGQSFVATLTNTRLFPQTLITLVAAGERTGELGDALLRAAKYFEAEVQTTLQMLTSLIEPLIVVCLGALVAGILILLYLPLFQLAAF